MGQVIKNIQQAIEVAQSLNSNSEAYDLDIYFIKSSELLITTEVLIVEPNENGNIEDFRKDNETYTFFINLLEIKEVINNWQQYSTKRTFTNEELFEVIVFYSKNNALPWSSLPS